MRRNGTRCVRGMANHGAALSCKDPRTYVMRTSKQIGSFRPQRLGEDKLQIGLNECGNRPVRVICSTDSSIYLRDCGYGGRCNVRGVKILRKEIKGHWDRRKFWYSSLTAACLGDLPCLLYPREGQRLWIFVDDNSIGGRRSGSRAFVFSA